MSVGSPAGASMDDDNWSDYSSQMAPDGVVADSPRVTLTSGLTFSIPLNFAGRAKGFWYKNISGAQTKSGTANSNSNPRIDRLVLRYDRAAKTITPVIVQGAPGASPQPPALSNGPNLFDTPICRATCPGSGSAQNYSNLVHDFVPISTSRAKHAWFASGLVGAGGTQFTNLAAPAAGTYPNWVQGNIASLSGSTSVLLNRPGSWALTMKVFSDSGFEGVSRMWWNWIDGPELFPDFTVEQSRVPKADLTNSGHLRQRLSWTGLVSPTEATKPITLHALWLANGPSINYQVEFYAHHLGG
jgi:hypothetical protein